MLKTCVKEGVTGAGGTTSNNNLGPLIKNIVNILLYALGAVAVVMIVIGGIKYTTSNGDSSAISSAKNTILYAVIGLVVALLAYAIVNFVISNL
jgi:TRAP-type C4-dicarboxylate transport system permease small subunit